MTQICGNYRDNGLTGHPLLDILLQTKDSDNAKSISIAEWQEIFGIITADARQPWTDSCDSYSEYLIIYFDYLIIPFDYLIIG